MEKPLISIIIPTKNEEKNIGRCLESIVNNGYPNFEIIVVDQESTDNTSLIVKSFKAKLINVNSSVKYIPPSQSRNVGFKHSHGEYIYHLDADMELEKGLLAEIVGLLNLPGASAVVIPEVDVPGNFWARGKAFERSLYRNTDMEAARATTRSVFSKILYNKNITSGEDWFIHAKYQKLGEIKRTSKIVKHYIGSLSLLREFRKKLHYGSASEDYLKESPGLKNRFISLFLLYLKGIVNNIFISPDSVIAFIIIRSVDTFALITGLIFKSR